MSTGQPDEILPVEKAGQLFMSLVQSGALPITGDIGQEPQPDDWSSFVLPTVQEAYAQDFTKAMTKAKAFGGRGKGKGKGYGMEGYSPYGGKGSDMMGQMNQMMGMM